MTQLIFIRNAETVQNKVSTVQSQKHGELSSIGVRQAKLLKVPLKGIRYTKVLSSPLQRSLQTAFNAGIAEPIVRDSMLKERNYGDMTDKSYQKIIGLKPDYRPKNGESTSDLIQRTSNFLQLLSKNIETILIFSHHDFILSCIHNVLNQPMKNYRRIIISNASITELIFQDKIWLIKRINEVSHLKSLDTTKKYD